MRLQRLQVFDYYGNKYYKPLGEFNVRSATHAVAIPNCTQYAFLRMHEECDQEKRQDTWIRESGGFGDAKNWWETTTLPKGNEIRVGAIAVFDGNCGHVAVVEKVYDNEHGDLSESNYSDNKSLRDWHFFNYRKKVHLVVGKATIAGVGKLKGYIYPPVCDITVKRDTSKYQVQINEEYVNVRKTAKGDIVNKGCYCPVGIYNVLDVEIVEGYKWYKLEEGHWVREGEWSVDLPADTSELEQLRKENAELKARLEDIGKAGGWIHG